MNKIEYEEILKSVGITSPSYKMKLANGKTEPVYIYNGMKIFFFNDNAIVRGRIPLEVATLTKKSYSDTFISIKGAPHFNIKPDQVAVDDILIKEQKDIINAIGIKPHEKEFCIRCARARFHNRSDQDKYITDLGIHRTDAFLYFLLQERDFILKCNKISSNETLYFEDKLREVYINFLKRVDPSFSPHAWMIDRSTYSEIYNRCNERVWEDENRLVIQDLVNEFDKALNPFINNEIEVEDLLNLDNFRIVGKVYEGHDEHTTNKKDCSEFSIHFNNGPNYSFINYTRGDDRFDLSIYFNIGKEGIYINHSFDSHLNEDHDTGEIIEIKSNKGTIEFNLSYNRIRRKFNLDSEPKEATVKDYNEIVSYLKLAISHAREKLYNKLYSDKGTLIL